MSHKPIIAVTAFTPRALTSTQALPAHINLLSMVNLAARQRTLSQRMILLTLLVTYPRLEPANARKTAASYHGPLGVGDIRSVAKEAKGLSFNAQIMAARAGQHGREFAMVANVLSDITGEIDGLTRQAAVLADRNKLAA